MDYSPPGSSVQGIWISQARILEWVAISSSKESSWHRDRTWVSCIGRWLVYHWVSWEALETPKRQKLPPVSPNPQKAQNPIWSILDSQYFLGGWLTSLRNGTYQYTKNMGQPLHWSCHWATETHFLAWLSDPVAMSPICFFHKFTFSNYKSNTCSVCKRGICRKVKIRK